jgi:hypothetical protein
MTLKISYKKFSISALFLLTLIGIGMIYFSKDIKSIVTASSFINGPQFYPILLASLLILFCIISIFDTSKKPDKIIELPNAEKLFVTLGVIVVWTTFWYLYGFFYPSSTIAVAVLLFYLNPAPIDRKKISITALSDMLIMAFVYLIFTVALKVQL